MNKAHKRPRRHTGRFGTFTTGISITMVLIMIGIITLFAGMATNYSNQLREGLTVELMLTDSITPQQMAATQARLKAAPWARQVTYISQEQGLRDMNEAMGTDIGTFDGTSPVPAEFEVSLTAPYANLDSIKRYEPSMLTLPGVAEVNYPRDIMQSLDRTIPAISLGLLVVAALLALVSFSLINNTMRMSVYARRYSIHTMKLVGASWGFIRRPFMWQALRIGLVSAIVAGGALSAAMWYLQFEAGAGSIYINTLVTPLVWAATLGAIFVCGLGLTALCASLSVNHHLRLRGGEVYLK